MQHLSHPESVTGAPASTRRQQREHAELQSHVPRTSRCRRNALILDLRAAFVKASEIASLLILSQYSPSSAPPPPPARAPADFYFFYFFWSSQGDVHVFVSVLHPQRSGVTKESFQAADSRRRLATALLGINAQTLTWLLHLGLRLLLPSAPSPVLPLLRRSRLFRGFFLFLRLLLLSLTST